MNSPFKESARQLLNKSYSVIPIAPNAKYPGEFSGWSWKPLSWGKYGEQLPTTEDLDTWEKWPNAGIGVALGKVSGIIALDFDDNIDGAHEKIASVIPVSPVKKIGKKGYTAFYRWKGETNKKWHPIVELLSSGNQTVIPPSIHKDTGSAYIWVDGVSLADVNKEDLPELPSDFIQKIDKILGREEPVAPPPSVKLSVPATQEEANEAIQYITPDVGYQEWLNIGMALRDEFGDSGFAIWDTWSRSGNKYPKKGEPTTRSKWKSFKNTGIGIGTLFHYAIEAGYVAPKPPESDNVVILSGGNLKPSAPSVEDKKSFPKELLKAPGLVGEIANWITETAPYPQPILSLAASIALVGSVMGHKAQSPTRSRSNMLTMSVAPSGSGKDHPQQCADILLRLAGLENLMGGDPVSSAGLLKSLKNGEGRRLIQIDEFGRVLKTLTNSRAASHQSSITTVMMKLFSKASTTYYGSEYADPNGDRNRDDIEQPCLCVHGATVPSHLYEAMTGSEAIDGFLSRWLIFESDYFPLDSRDVGDIDNPPTHLLEQLRYWAEKKSNGGGNLEGITHFNIETIPYSPDAESKAKEFQREMRKRSIQHEEQQTGYAPIWARAYEHATKLALVAHESGKIDRDCIEWACATAEYCMQYLCDSVEQHISNNEQEKNTKFVLGIIRKQDGTLWRSQLTRKTQRLKPRDRTDILQTLVDSGQIDIVQEMNGSGRPKIGYVAI